MTAIAYKDGVLAADTQATCGQYRAGADTKIMRVGGAMAGASGDSVWCHKFMVAFQNGDWRNFVADVKKDESFSALIIDADGSVWLAIESGVMPAPKASFYAEGAAYGFLMGAMAAGASAEQAVALAIGYCTGCGGEVQTLSLVTRVTD